jgi:outer membrane protein TolC
VYHRQETAEAALVQADSQYTVITAFQNVADSLRALQAGARAIDYGQAAAAPAGHLFRIAERGAYLSAIFSGARAGASQSLH